MNYIVNLPSAYGREAELRKLLEDEFRSDKFSFKRTADCERPTISEEAPMNTMKDLKTGESLAFPQWPEVQSVIDDYEDSKQ